MAAGLNIAGLQLDTAPLAQHDGEQVSFNSRSQMSVSLPSSPTALSLASPEGIDCYGNERQVLSDQAKFYNNTTLSDVTLVVGGNKFYAHKLILVRSSDVFERMLSEEWNDGSKKVSIFIQSHILVIHVPVNTLQIKQIKLKKKYPLSIAFFCLIF